MMDKLPAEAHDTSAVQEPPKTISGIVRHLGPGLIIAGSIVGSGELIATTTTGAQAGFWLLWVILIGCVIKVFVQVELGRFVIANGRTTLAALAEVPGPRVGTGNWLIWYWVAMFLVGIGQLGGIVGGVGQALSISVPITEAGRQYNAAVDSRIKLIVQIHERQVGDGDANDTELERQKNQIDEQIELLRPLANDHKYWAAIITAVTAAILVAGRYGLIQTFSAFMVALFTLITIINLVALQSYQAYAVSWEDIVRGMSFRLTPKVEALGESPLVTALAAFGIIGVGASELVSYPYWCLEKGYARFTGPHDQTSGWARRAQGWMNVMRWDAWCSMVVYTFATIAFYLLGAAILGRIRLAPEGAEMIRTLAIMYEPVFGGWTQLLFLFGAFAVLYSTFFVANAANARLSSDVLGVFGVAARDERAYLRRVRLFSGITPFLCLLVYIFFPQPTKLVLASGVMQAIMLPMLSGAALYFRYQRCDHRIRPGIVWDICLWISALGMLLAGGWLAWTKILSALEKFG